MAKKVALLIAHKDYQPTEYGIVNEILTSNNVETITASDEPTVATATDGSTTDVDTTIDRLNPVELDGLFVIGGKGALDCLDNPTVHTLLQQMMTLKKLYGAICISTRILAKAEVLAHKKATGWNKDDQLQDIFNQHDAKYIREPVVTDGLVITADGPESAGDFAEAILKAIKILK